MTIGGVIQLHRRVKSLMYGHAPLNPAMMSASGYTPAYSNYMIENGKCTLAMISGWVEGGMGWEGGRRKAETAHGFLKTSNSDGPETDTFSTPVRP